MTSATSSLDASECSFDNNGVGLQMNGGSLATIFACRIFLNTTSLIEGVRTNGNNTVIDNQVNTSPSPNIGTQ